MFVVIDEITYRENDIVNYDNSYGHIKGIIKYGEWVQNSSDGEYKGFSCTMLSDGKTLGIFKPKEKEVMIEDVRYLYSQNK